MISFLIHALHINYIQIYFQKSIFYQRHENNDQFVSFIIQYGPCKINLKCTYHLHEVVPPPKKNLIHSTNMSLPVSQILEPETMTQAPTASPIL